MGVLCWTVMLNQIYVRTVIIFTSVRSLLRKIQCFDSSCFHFTGIHNHLYVHSPLFLNENETKESNSLPDALLSCENWSCFWHLWSTDSHRLAMLLFTFIVVHGEHTLINMGFSKAWTVWIQYLRFWLNQIFIESAKIKPLVQDFVRVVAHFRPVKKNPAKNKLNTRWEN